MINIAVLGFGTVGSGVYSLLKKNKDLISDEAGQEIKIKYILDIRDFFHHEDSTLFTKDFNVVLNDNDVSIVVEVIGGEEPAYQFTKSALLSGKSVVSSNKALVAAHGTELLEIAKQGGVHYLFEASVGGGIPILRALNTSFSGNNIKSITGILNGTTNYMLSKMINDGKDYEEVLKSAQEKGYAERNPEADVEGYDTCRKLAILSSLVLGYEVDYRNIYTEGITKIEPFDVEYAQSMDHAIKLIGLAKFKDGKVFAQVSPMFVPFSSPISGVDNVFNGISVVGDFVGETMFYGKGAGMEPTASAVVADIIDIAKGINENNRFGWAKSDVNVVIEAKAEKGDFFVRSKEEIPDAFSMDIGIEGEIGCIVRGKSMAELDKLAKEYKGIIKYFRMI